VPESIILTEKGNPPAPGLHSIGTSWPTGTVWGMATADAWYENERVELTYQDGKGRTNAAREAIARSFILADGSEQ
jgi:hypothetical protein